MNSNVLTTEKIKQYYKHCYIALDFFLKNDPEHALINFRKSAEAFMKLSLIKHFGEKDGEDIYLGKIDTELNPTIGISRPLDYQELLNIMWDKKIWTTDVKYRLKDIQGKSNTAAHNPNQITKFHQHAELCKAQSLELTNFLYPKIDLLTPSELLSAYQGQINSAVIADLRSSEWDRLSNLADTFSKHQKYLLVAPPQFDANILTSISSLSRISWSFVVDFDPNSKESGLFKAFEALDANSFVPLTIKQKGQKNIVGAGTNNNINWLFANGLTSLPDTQAKGIRSWLSMRYVSFVKQLFQEYFTKEISRYTIIYLWDDLDFIEEIVRAIVDIDQLPQDLVTHIFLSNEQDIVDKLRAFEKYDIIFDTFKISQVQFLSKLTSTLPPIEQEKSGIFVPARTKIEENTSIEISNIYYKLLDDHISVVHQQIENTEQELSTDILPPFYQGELITWKDLSVNIEAERTKYEELYTKVIGHLNNSKKSIKFELLHKPGGGGTTLAHRLAFNLKKSYPVIIISKYEDSRTFSSLKLFLNQVNRPTLAVIESSLVSVNDVENLIKSCNAEKHIVCFIYLRRSISATSGGEFSIFLNDTMQDLNERNRFLSKANLYAAEKAALIQIEKLSPTDTEVIDFPLAINEKEYNNEKIIDYIGSYLEKMTEEQERFCVFVSMVYHYTQKPVSELVFRSLFDKGLTQTLRKTPESKQYIRKLMIQEYDLTKNTYKEYWRPRFSKFAEGILKKVVGGSNPNDWKDHIATYSHEFLARFKENNEYLVDETQDILKSLFFERNNEDLLGTAEQWKSSINNEQFSFLLRDIGDKQKQKALLEAIVRAYPNENHFFGHLGRFLYEKAEEESEFIEAEKYIKEALSIENGYEDYNLQHLGGMCYRRRLEFLKRQNRSSNVEQLTLETIINLGNSANEYFDASRRINPYNVHAYVAQIQTQILTIDLGTEISLYENKADFITASGNRWFLEQLNNVRSLIDEAEVIVEQQETLGRTSKTLRAKYYLDSGEGRYYEALGNYNVSVAHFQKLIETVDRDYRPFMRRMFIHASLLRKVKGNRKNIDYAWEKLREDEITVIEKTINDDILQNGSNIFALRNWFKLVRYSSIEISIDEVIARLQMWYDQSNDSDMLKLEAAFYLYVVHAVVALRSESISQHHKNEANKFIAKCVELSKNTRHNYEYLGQGDGLDSLVNHRNRSSHEDYLLERLKGTISVISSRQTGRISLACGLDAFFVPYAGSFIQGIDETEPVTFLIGFRHDGLFAFDVNRLNQKTEVPTTEMAEEPSREFLELTKEPEQVEELNEVADPPSDSYKLPGLKILDKIDLTKVRRR